MRDGYYGMDGLVWQLRAEERTNMWQEYMASIVYAIGKLQSEKWPFPTYTSLVHPELKPKPDSRTGQDILNRLKERLESG